MTPMNRLLCGAALAVASILTPLSGNAQTVMGVALTEPGESNATKHTVLGLNKSTVVDLDSSAADVVITNPQIADAVVQTSKRIIFRGVTVGQTNAFVFDKHGKQILNLEIRVEQDLTALEDMIERYVPDARVNVAAVNDGLVIDGVVDSLTQSDQVLRLAGAFMGADNAGSDDGPNIVNLMSISAKDQVMLEVRIVEMQRNIVKQLGINLSGSTNFGELASESLQTLNDVDGRPLFFDAPTTTDPGLGLNNVGEGNALQSLQGAAPFSESFGFTSANGFNVAGSALGGLNATTGYTNFLGDILQSSVGASIDALKRIGIVSTLAEPNITAVSGESAKFLAGGEFPVPVGQDNNGRITIEFKPFGVGLGFTPVVLSEGNISLKVSTEVSELTSQGAFQGQSVAGVDDNGNVITAQTLTIPALSVRRAESTIELPSGSSMMMAGLIQTRTRQSLDQLPGIKKLPILGALFQSRDFVNEETELVVIVTPYLVDPTQKKKLRTPADGFANAADPKTIFFGKLNAMYGDPEQEVDSAEYRAPVGFIEE